MKIISYSIFGREQYYQHGVRRNIALAKLLFPGWVVRLYVEKETQADIISEFSDTDNVELIIKSQRFPYDGAHWRILPLQEGHEIVIIRDVDTTLTDRDVALVEDWLDTPYKYHVARDEPGMKATIMAGIWGAKSPRLNILTKWDKFYKNKTIVTANDQSFLDKHIYPFIRKNLVVYSEFNVYEGESHIRKIPHNIKKDKDGLYQAIGTRVAGDISDEDDNLNDIKGINFTRKKESGKEAVKWFNGRYDKSHITILKPRYKYNNILINEIYWLSSNLFDKGPIYFVQVLSRKLKHLFSIF
jgi:hypothetical protein